MSKAFRKVIFDNIHGYINLNRVETRILETLYYQRLRWIRQLGFSFYIYPGATHTRHAHALGVSHVMDRILKALNIAAPEDRLFDPSARDKETTFHRTMRLAAMLHDIGTFPFSHSIEMAYINHWRNIFLSSNLYVLLNF
jgi:HD superfamily phosphohydrolase